MMGQRHQHSLAERPTSPKADGGRVMFAVPERGPVEDLETVSLIGANRVAEQLGKFPLRR